MVAMDMLDAFREGSKLVSRSEDDMYDRLSNKYSIGLILVLILFISSFSYLGDPIECFEPAEFSDVDNWVEYMDNICWVSNTYYVPINETIPGKEEPKKQMIQYYQWVPIILTIQAFFFMVPGMLWNAVSDSAGYNVKDVVSVTKGTDSMNPEVRDGSIAYLINNMIRSINFRQPYSKTWKPMGKRYGRYIHIMYLLTKCLYIINAVLQIVALNGILGDEYSSFGVKAISNWSNGKGWESSPVFPRITLCSFEIRRLGQNINRYTVQCLLSINLFIEMAYFVLWWWLLLVIILSSVGLLLWLLTATAPATQRLFVAKYLKIMNRSHHQDELQNFVSNFLRMDGVFTLRLIAKNTNDAVTGEVVAALWDKHLETLKDRKGLLNGEAESTA